MRAGTDAGPGQLGIWRSKNDESENYVYAIALLDDA